MNGARIPGATSCGGEVLAVTPMEEHHWNAVHSIYQAGIDTGHATFADAPPQSWSVWTVDHINELSRVAVAGDLVLGWAALSRVSGRCVYSGVGEISIYVAPEHSGRGVGRALLSALIECTELAGYWTLQAGIFPENAASLALHRAAGFDLLGVHHRLGKMTYGPLAGRWRDVLLLERRSATVGID